MSRWRGSRLRVLVWEEQKPLFKLKAYDELIRKEILNPSNVSQNDTFSKPAPLEGFNNVLLWDYADVGFQTRQNRCQQPHLRLLSLDRTTWRMFAHYQWPTFPQPILQLICWCWPRPACVVEAPIWLEMGLETRGILSSDMTQPSSDRNSWYKQLTIFDGLYRAQKPNYKRAMTVLYWRLIQMATVRQIMATWGTQIWGQISIW